jgi:hypothetical protein
MFEAYTFVGSIVQGNAARSIMTGQQEMDGWCVHELKFTAQLWVEEV